MFEDTDSFISLNLEQTNVRKIGENKNAFAAFFFFFIGKMRDKNTLGKREKKIKGGYFLKFTVKKIRKIKTKEVALN